MNPDSRDIPSRPCWPSVTPRRRPVGPVVITVGVEDLLDTAGDGLDDLGVAFARLAEQAGLHVVAIHRRDAGRQGVEGPTDHPQMILADRAGLQRGGHQRQLRADAGPVSWRRGWMRAATLIRRLTSLGAIRSRAAKLLTTIGAIAVSSGGSAIWPNIR